MSESRAHKHSLPGTATNATHETLHRPALAATWPSSTRSPTLWARRGIRRVSRAIFATPNCSQPSTYRTTSRASPSALSASKVCSSKLTKQGVGASAAWGARRGLGPRVGLRGCMGSSRHVQLMMGGVFYFCGYGWKALSTPTRKTKRFGGGESGSIRSVCRNRAAGKSSAPRGETLLW